MSSLTAVIIKVNGESTDISEVTAAPAVGGHSDVTLKVPADFTAGLVTRVIVTGPAGAVFLVDLGLVQVEPEDTITVPLGIEHLVISLWLGEQPCPSGPSGFCGS